MPDVIDTLRELGEHVEAGSAPVSTGTVTRLVQRRRRRRRAAYVIGASAVAAAVVAAGFGLARDDDRSPYVSVGPPASTAVPSTTVPIVPLQLSAIDTVPDVPVVGSRSFAHGTGAGQVGAVPSHESAPEGPEAFTASSVDDVAIFDTVNGRVLRVEHGTTTDAPIDAATYPGPAAMDAKHRLVVSDGSGGYTVVGPDGKALLHVTAADLSFLPRPLSRLDVQGADVYLADGYSRVRFLHDDGSGYRLVRDAPFEDLPLRFTMAHGDQRTTILRNVAPRAFYRLDVPWDAFFPAYRVLADGRVVAVVSFDTFQVPAAEVAGRTDTYYYGVLVIDRDGNVGWGRFAAASGDLPNGPLVEFHDDSFAVMSDDGNATIVTLYRYPEIASR
jgi:hypothetical protein